MLPFSGSNLGLPMTSIARLFSSLEGQWNFHRTISQNGIVQGLATFTKSDATTLLYREEGEWTQTKTTSYQVYQEYIYALKDGSIAVYFAKTPRKLFHVLTFPVLNKALASHQCKRDLYGTCYRFINPNQFSITHTIAGPQKNMTITTQFTRKETPC